MYESCNNSPFSQVLPISPTWHRQIQEAVSILIFSRWLQLPYLLFIAKKLLLFHVCLNSCKKSFLMLSPCPGSTGTGWTCCYELHDQVSSCMRRQVFLQSSLFATGLRGASCAPSILAASCKGCRSIPVSRGQAGSRLRSRGGWEARDSPQKCFPLLLGCETAQQAQTAAPRSMGKNEQICQTPPGLHHLLKELGTSCSRKQDLPGVRVQLEKKPSARSCFSS